MGNLGYFTPERSGVINRYFNTLLLTGILRFHLWITWSQNHPTATCKMYQGVKLVQKTLSNDLPSWDSGNGCRVSWWNAVFQISSEYLVSKGVWAPFLGRTSGGVCGSKHRSSQGIWKTRVGLAVKVGWKKRHPSQKKMRSFMYGLIWAKHGTHVKNIPATWSIWVYIGGGSNT